jgi:hypothetical protein
MKKIEFAVVLFMAIAICSCKDKAADTVESRSQVSNEDLPMPVSYKGQSSIGSNNNTVVVMNWNKYVSMGQIDSAFTLLADSVAINLADGTTFNTKSDSIKTILHAYVNNMKSMKIQYVAVLPIDVKTSGTQTDEWVLSWTDEEFTMKDGSVEHNIVHEDYRLVNGKIRQVNQYARKVAAPKVAKS